MTINKKEKGFVELSFVKSIKRVPTDTDFYTKHG